jgi:predicted DNA-binding helix-hairpin-helix protein
MELEEKLNLLGGGAEDDTECATCAANPSATLLTHRATEPLLPGPAAAPHRGARSKELGPWLTTVIRGGRRMPIVKTLMTSACEKDCFYCPTRRGRNRLRRETFKPEELASGVDQVHTKGLAEGLFLSSGIVGGGTRTMEKTIAAVEILRNRYAFRGYVHLKLMPGAEPAAIERALQLADRVSVNLEAPNSARLARLSSTKQFTEELLAPLKIAHKLIENDPRLRDKSMTTQLVVGAADESDREIVSTTFELYRQLHLARVYYSAFHPVIDTPLENHAPTPALRQARLYQSDFLLRNYGFTHDELVFDDRGNLPLDRDPKILWALGHPERYPIEVNNATREELYRIPGLGPKSVERILRERRDHKLTCLDDLARLGASDRRAAPFVTIEGKSPPRQLSLF